MRSIDQTELRQIFPAPEALVVSKQLTRLDKHCLQFLSLSPFALIGTRSQAGGDVSPRGDPRGFVHVLDENTFLIPDRPGNNRLDTMENILADPVVGCLFLVPGLGEILRVNGVADIVAGGALEALSIQGRAPRVAIRVHVREVFFHCSKAVIRSKLWNPATFATREDFPPLGEILADQIAGLDKEEMVEKIRVGDQRTLY
ncbi:pyridoxamine 5'-phosphate oxidase family protein (plasmid) [Ensifer sp. PDNC004]|uniref:MSMEG_1061 family FMN-dependent PPOX-type flavoprotein n=1 Tax=Ensifer sp. PDNC004 TaxID=2811423 RepID=UPI00196614FE|nr:MSMEG_1061 family FMN-dependent PPOX-type flavoprotein [Ensifer sp. PDNC004]QRY70821.1 pyridoxamine 5'-phosphate oxidase family protein [Ensifer sp. PDNC004]